MIPEARFPSSPFQSAVRAENGGDRAFAARQGRTRFDLATGAVMNNATFTEVVAAPAARGVLMTYLDGGPRTRSEPLPLNRRGQ